MDTETIQAVAKATEAVAVTTGKAIDVVSAVGKFSNRLIGDALAQGGGMLTEQVAHWRKMRLLNLEAKFNAACAARGMDPDTMRPLTLSQTVQMLEAASLEESDEVQDLWAELLANAADPASGVTLKKLHINLLKELGPADAALLEVVSELRAYHGKQFANEEIEQLAHELLEIVSRRWRKFTEPDRIGAIVNLRRLGCIAPDIRPPDTRELLTRSAVQEATRTGHRGRETQVVGIEPHEFVRFVDWLFDALMSAGGATVPTLDDGFVLRGQFGDAIREIELPEFSLALTPLGAELLTACAKPNKGASLGAGDVR